MENGTPNNKLQVINAGDLQPMERPKDTGIASVENLLAQAVEKGLPVETMERLLAMRRELNAEQAKRAFDHDMANFQMECPTIKKTKGVRTKSGQIAYKYAPIESIVDQVKPYLQKYGFSYSTQTINTADRIKAVCIVKHVMGHSESYEMEVPLGNKTEIMSQTQVTAAATTFAKRYAFCNAFGILTGDEDTDAAPVKNEQPEAKQEKPLSQNEMFIKAQQMISKTSDKAGLQGMIKKFDESPKYSDGQKTTLKRLVNERIKAIK